MKRLLPLVFTLFVTVALAQQPVPSFRLAASDGKTYTQVMWRNKRAIVVIFSEGCPHNAKAAPILREFASDVRGKVLLYGVLNAGQKEATEFARSSRFNFPVLADPSRVLIGASRASHGLDFVVLDSRGPTLRFSEIFEGLSRNNVAKAASSMKSFGFAEPKYRESIFPTTRLSGCAL